METIAFLEDCQIINVDLTYDKYCCKENKWRLLVSGNIENLRDFQKLNKVYNLIYEWILRQGISCPYNGNDYYWKFYLNEEKIVKDDDPYYINVANLLNTYPKMASSEPHLRVFSLVGHRTNLPVAEVMLQAFGVQPRRSMAASAPAYWNASSECRPPCEESKYPENAR